MGAAGWIRGFYRNKRYRKRMSEPIFSDGVLMLGRHGKMSLSRSWHSFLTVRLSSLAEGMKVNFFEKKRISFSNLD